MESPQAVSISALSQSTLCRAPRSDEHDELELIDLAARDEAFRTLALDKVEAILINWGKDQEDPNAAANLLRHLPSVLRLTKQCPFADVRNRLTTLLHTLEDLRVNVPRCTYQGASYFIPQRKLPSLATEDDALQRVFAECFMYDSRITHMSLVMAFHPDFMECFVRTHSFLLWGDGPLPLCWRNYIAMLAASRHRCTYIVSLQKSYFLMNGGDPEWLKGIEHAPKKMQLLNELNALLAHRPWQVRGDHIKALLRGADSWSTGELLQAVVLLAEFHSLSSFVFGVGLTPEIDKDGGNTLSKEGSAIDPADVGVSSELAGGNPNESWMEGVVASLRKLVGEEEEEEEEEGEEVRLRHFEQSETELGMAVEERKEGDAGPPASATSDFGYFRGEFREFRHADFDIRTDTVLREQDYSWQDHGFSLVSRFYPEVAPLLDQQFQRALDMTDNRIGNLTEEMDTRKFRVSIWYYIHRISGILHDDYKYSEVNRLLERPAKQYIKKMVCYPELITRTDFDAFGKDLRDSEKCHLTLLALESRKQAELLHAAHALTEYMS